MYSPYSTFIAEVASNVHQALVRSFLLRPEAKRDLKIAVLEEAMANFFRYLFIMPTLARFELETHQRVERGEALTAEAMIDLMTGLLEEAYGRPVKVDRERDGMLWAAFPHLFEDYYAFQYETGIAGAQAISRSGSSAARAAADGYLRFLSLGSSEYPIDALRIAGVDLSPPEPVEEAFDVMDSASTAGGAAGITPRLPHLPNGRASPSSDSPSGDAGGLVTRTGYPVSSPRHGSAASSSPPSNESRRADSLLCVGLDPSLDIPGRRRVPAHERRHRCHDGVCLRVQAQQRILRGARRGGVDRSAAGDRHAHDAGRLVILDAKRGDIASTAEAYAAACFDVLGADAVTVNPLLGGDSVDSFACRADKGVFLLCHTSNPGARDLQEQVVGGRPLFELLAEKARGVEHAREHRPRGRRHLPRDAARVREIGPDMWILLPGSMTSSALSSCWPIKPSFTFGFANSFANTFKIFAAALISECLSPMTIAVMPDNAPLKFSNPAAFAA